MLIRAIIILLLSITNLSSENLKNCEWNNEKGIPCIKISKTPNTSDLTELGINKLIITKQDIINSGASDAVGVLSLVPGLDVFQNGPTGQSTSIFIRGSESNHTLVMINGIAINDQSVTDGLHDFGQDFIQHIQQIEVYKGSSGAHFGPSAIAGAINFITSIDYTNSYSTNWSFGNNDSIDGNYTKITDNGWHLNLKGATNRAKEDSAIANGTEEDRTKNYQLNFNTEKQISDNLKFNSTLYSRNTFSQYDLSATNEVGPTVDNSMYALQTTLNHKSKKSDDVITFHYHNYDREYFNSGVEDEYDSESFVVRGERKIAPINNNFSFGYGTEYKYDWGAFENRGSYAASTKGHMKDFALFGNFGFKITENSVLSYYLRTDDHNTTDRNQTHKTNITTVLGKFKLGATNSTGLRNPTLYELYGTDNFGIAGNVNLMPEKSKTNELSLNYNFSENLSFGSSAFKSKIYDQIESNAAYTKHTNELNPIKQVGLDSELLFNGDSQSFSIFSNFLKSRKANGRPQNRRPDLSYGGSYAKKLDSNLIGPFNMNLNYRYTGKQIDYDGTTNSKQKSVEIVNASLSKNLYNGIFSINISNLLNERYEKPATYSQNGRQLRFGYTNKF